MNTKIKIVSFQPENQQPIKTKDNMGRAAFGCLGVYHLENGETHPARIVSRRLKDLPGRLEDETRMAENGNLSIEGGFIIRSYYIGPKKAA